MKKTTLTIIASFIACSTLFSSVSWADGPGDHRWDPHGGDRHQDRGPGPDHHDRRDFGHDRGPGPDLHDHYADHRMPEGHRGGDRFAWRDHDFRRGYPAPPEFRGPHYRVDDWRARGLYEAARRALGLYRRKLCVSGGRDRHYHRHFAE